MSSQLVQELSEHVGVSQTDVEHIISSAPRRYKVYEIPKRSGQGTRLIAHPARELKPLQRFVVLRTLHGLPVHPSAHGYVPHRGIRTNALPHVANRFLLKIDLKDFFPSIVPRDLKRRLCTPFVRQLSKEEILQIEQLLFWRPKGDTRLRLSIGAPSSPFVSNVVLFELDSQIAKYCNDSGVIYTRYADDLTFSTSTRNTLGNILASVQELLRVSTSPAFVINPAKTAFSSKKHKRVITGVVLNNEGSLSLGRARKRMLRAVAHKAVLERLSAEDASAFTGHLAFAADIEPAFAERLREWMRRKRTQGADDGSGN